MSIWSTVAEYTAHLYLSSIETIYVKNYYDSTISGSTSTIQSITTAVNFLDLAYRANFNLHFVMDGSPEQYSQAAVDICNFHANAPCNSLHTGSNCDNSCSNHHKNVHRIADDVYPSSDNTVVIMWSNCEAGIYCAINKSGVHEEDHLSLALVTYEDTAMDRVFDPVVQFLTIDQHTLIQDKDCTNKVFMSLILAHEIAHTLGMSDVYNNLTYANAPHISNNSECIMELFGNIDASSFYDNILYNDYPPMCADCIQILNSEIADDSYAN